MASRKSRKQKKQAKRSQRRSKKQGGAVLVGAPLGYVDDWSAKMSAGQGGDYLKYHVGQHGGALDGVPLSAMDSALPAAMRGPAHIGGLDQAFSQIAGLKDQAGGKRHKRSTRRHARKAKKQSKRSRRHSKKGGKRRHAKKSSKRSRKHGRKHSRRHSKKHGGALGYAAVATPSMLLDSDGYAKAGLTPQWSAGAEFDAAKARASM